MNVYPVKVIRDGKELTVTLKLDTKHIRILSEQYDNRSILDIITDASGNPGVLGDILNASLQHRNNDNPKGLDGDELLDLLIENGFGGMEKSMALANDIAVVSGIMEKEQAIAMKNSVERKMKKILDSLNNDEEAEEEAVPPTRKGKK